MVKAINSFANRFNFRAAFLAGYGFYGLRFFLATALDFCWAKNKILAPAL
jgi:hypothetical protein